MKIVLATGGTGGHLFPALEVAKVLRKKGHELFFLGSFGLGTNPIEQNGFIFRELNARGLNSLKINHLFSFLVRMLRATFRSWNYLKKIKPDAIAGFGGYGAFPVILAAIFLRYPILIHEQNVVPGRANRVLAHFVWKIAVSFQQSRFYFRRQTILTGCPTRFLKTDFDKKEILKNFSLEENKTTILVFGGSQGSQRINETFIQTAEGLRKDLNFQVVHIAGQRDTASLREEYLKLKIPFALFSFLEHMEYAYTLADLVISRAGASTITEIDMFQKPAILIPYPYAHGHQRENALVLTQTQSVQLIEEKDLTTEKLKEKILFLVKMEKKDGEGYNNIYISDAAERLASEIENCQRKRICERHGKNNRFVSSRNV